MAKYKSPFNYVINHVMKQKEINIPADIELLVVHNPMLVVEALCQAVREELKRQGISDEKQTTQKTTV